MSLTLCHSTIIVLFVIPVSLNDNVLMSYITCNENVLMSYIYDILVTYHV
jgi:hypothetical protein